MSASEELSQTEVQENTSTCCKCSFPYFLEVTTFLYCIPYAAFTTINVLYIYHRLALNSPLANVSGYEPSDHGSTCSKVDNTSTVHQSEVLQTLELEIKSQTSEWEIYIMMSLYLPGVISIPLLGTYSDKYGRKQGLALPAIGGVISGLGYIIVEKFKLDIAYLIIPTFIEGCLGYLLGFSSVMYAYMADITEPNNRMYRFVFVNAVYCLVNALGTMFSGYMVAGLGYLDIFWIMTSIYLATLLFIVFFVPQHVPSTEQNTQFEVLVILYDLLMVFKVYIKRRTGQYQRCNLVMLIAAVLLTCTVVSGNLILETLFLIGLPYCLTSVQVGLFNGIVAIVGAVGSVIVVRLLEICLSDVIITIIALLMTTIAFLIEALNKNTIFFFVAFPPFYLLAIAVLALLRAIMSRMVQPVEQGALQASISICGALGQVLSVLILVGIYNATMTTFNGFVFLCCAIIEGCTAGLLVFVLGLGKNKDPADEPLLISHSASENSCESHQN